MSVESILALSLAFGVVVFLILQACTRPTKTELLLQVLTPNTKK